MTMLRTKKVKPFLIEVKERDRAGKRTVVVRTETPVNLTPDQQKDWITRSGHFPVKELTFTLPGGKATADTFLFNDGTIGASPMNFGGKFSTTFLNASPSVSSLKNKGRDFRNRKISSKGSSRVSQRSLDKA